MEAVRHDEPEIDREPDARVELSPFQPGSVADLQDQVVTNLLCQVRDCYLTMGVAPPEPVRIQGPGTFQRSTWFQHYDVYQRYHDTAADIDWEVPESAGASVG